MGITREDGWQLFFAFVALVTGIITISVLDLSESNLINHIKIIYIIFWSTAVIVWVWVILTKTKGEKSGKKRTR